MKIRPLQAIICYCLFACVIFPQQTQAQDKLNTVFQNLFQQILGDETGEGGALEIVNQFDAQGNIIGNHAEHFIDASIEARDILTPALNSLIAGNVSSFPLSSTSAGVTFDFSTGQPVSIKESLGPIFAETGKTLGQKKFNIGLNYTYLDLTKFRGLDVDNLTFVFTHEDVGRAGLGDSPNESDLLSVNLGLDINASIFAYAMTYGVTKNFDIGIALPVVNISMQGPATATINSFTLAQGGQANHLFQGGTRQEPRLQQNFGYSRSAFGIGDLAVRLKYSFQQGSGLNVAALLDMRLPTGDEEDFLGTGEANVRMVGIISQKFGDFTPHLNMAYDVRGADLDSDELEFALGFDQKLASGLTFAVDLLGELDLNSDEAIVFPESVIITDQVKDANGEILVMNERTVEKTNIPARDNDSILNAAVGFRYSPAESLIFLGNALIALNESGLRSTIVPTFGVAFSF